MIASYLIICGLFDVCSTLVSCQWIREESHKKRMELQQLTHFPSPHYFHSIVNLSWCRLKNYIECWRLLKAGLKWMNVENKRKENNKRDEKQVSNVIVCWDLCDEFYWWNWLSIGGKLDVWEVVRCYVPKDNIMRAVKLIAII